MSAYVILELSVFDSQEMEAYKKQAPETVAAFGGKFVVRGGAVLSLEGDWQPERLVIIEFPSLDRAHEWWNSEMYAAAKAIRERAAHAKVIIVEGV